VKLIAQDFVDDGWPDSPMPVYRQRSISGQLSCLSCHKRDTA